jgi:hypothetical protein
MSITFQAIGIEIPNETAFNDLAADVGRRGEASLLHRTGGTLHGRCLKIGGGLEIWTVLYESRKGELVYADCRPAFRARHGHFVSPWVLTEFAEEGAALVHGFLEDTDFEVLFELQNLTEVGIGILDDTKLEVGLCGLAFSAHVFNDEIKPSWRPADGFESTAGAEENHWSLAGRIKDVERFRNPASGDDLWWINVDLRDACLEVVVNSRSLFGEMPLRGAFIQADVWLQGHILGRVRAASGYEGTDFSVNPADFWRALRKPN